MSQSPVHILLVEDDEDDYMLTAELIGDISDACYEITWASSFEDGIEKLTSSPFDICLVDYRMGGRSGLDFVQETNWLGLTVPLVFLTGMGDRETDIAAMEAGAYDFLQKSDLTPAILDRAIRYAISLGKSRRALLERTTLLQATLDNTGAAIAAVDPVGKMVAWNDRFVELVMKLSNNGDDRARELSNVRLERWLPIFSCSWDEFDSGDGQILSIRRNDTPDGGAVIVCNDITQHKRAEQAMREAMLQAESANASKSAFLANISHELRTPLNAIIGFADLMTDQVHGPMGSPEYDGYISIIKESGSSLLSIINATLDLARIEAHEYPLDLHQVVLQDTVSCVLHEITEAAEAKDIQFEVRSGDDELCFVIDENALRKVLAQVLSNAIKFSHSGGLVIVEMRRSDGVVEIDVTDHGIGMGEAEIECALSAFSQVDEKLARNYDGVGLGLPLSRALVELHDGQLTILSECNKGTTVSIRLPGEPSGTQEETCEALPIRNKAPALA